MNEGFFDIPLDRRQRAETDEFSFVLKPSHIQGVGVMATHGIAQGTRLALFPDGATRKVTRAEIEGDPRLAKFCRVYGLESASGSVVAANFGCMSIGWYLNHADMPSAHHDDDWEYFASRDIAAGEEITIDYRLLRLDD